MDSNQTSSTTISPQKPTLNSETPELTESDKQILTWASKLELESVDLREKSSSLSREVRRCSNVLSNKFDDFKDKLIDPKEIKSIFDVLMDLSTRVIDQQKAKISSAQLDEIAKSIIELKDVKNHKEEGEKFGKIFEEITKKFTLMENSVKSVNDQLSNVTTILFSMNKSLEDLSIRQSALEELLRTQNNENEKCHQQLKKDHQDIRERLLKTGDMPFKIRKIISSNDDMLQGTTIENDSDFEIAISPGPNNEPGPMSSPNQKRRRDFRIRGSRTIIPWEEVEM
ncbi:hypothetical protein TBLA_0B07590 [Henningerozyma blattae CBS 6284]|uniref:Uncharacterized protein n=1 Tax=Henningerozyma blattae (strain ATCC 34711 / CBS 6284 / DSM 70876 / NBRC 10599 / NRRL Y-10934 / UCD 77-7) TaxID=1071380 RepID=I2GZM4_HENB6|nr:hypothetical protein TBLA_0B07590 [Tetrapisispora blattae CBS 6284]CCH59576.1 hypothetical protein TBLA_0B07590 [Tetrapisispora blattae CBS 6284]